MHKVLILVLTTLSLSACSDPIADAERELQIVENSGGSPEELCAAKRKVASEYLKAQREADYQAADASADLACSSGPFR